VPIALDKTIPKDIKVKKVELWIAVCLSSSLQSRSSANPVVLES
jgi:hypothetical protein